MRSMLAKIASALGVRVVPEGSHLANPPDRKDQGAPAKYAPFGQIDGSNLRPAHADGDGLVEMFTAASAFGTVSRGDPVIQDMDAEAAAAAGLAPQTWRLEIAASPFGGDPGDAPHAAEAASLPIPRTIDDGNPIDLGALRELGQRHGCSVIKAMQCLNVESPLGQGVWEGVPLAVVLKEFCGTPTNCRRINFWGYHNEDEAQKFVSSVSYTECFEPVPGEPPVFLAYALNGEPLPLSRGGPVRIVVPWAHGFKSVKWLTHIEITNDYRVADTYASLDGMNDPFSHLKTAAYIDGGSSGEPGSVNIETVPTYTQGQSIVVTGTAISGRTPLQRVEYWVRPVEPMQLAGPAAMLPDDASELLNAMWRPATLQAAPQDWEAALPRGSPSPAQISGFDTITENPSSWPLRYSYVGWSATLDELQPGEYEIRARTVDSAGNAQPQPRPQPKSGRNGIQVKRIAVVPDAKV
eukprot:COSAG02_NODE_708_length_18231_cov_53.208416_10_plen_466_part_00